jgi:hypothetical protein
MQESPKYIGMATMDANRNIILDLRAEDGQGAVGISRLVYPPSHKQYAAILTHLDGLQPGENKPVAPWPNTP